MQAFAEQGGDPITILAGRNSRSDCNKWSCAILKLAFVTPPRKESLAGSERALQARYCIKRTFAISWNPLSHKRGILRQRVSCRRVAVSNSATRRCLFSSGSAQGRLWNDLVLSSKALTLQANVPAERKIWPYWTTGIFKSPTK
ncbi:hypothetical protein CC2G_005183 [Coprinopsis cinerea AmutBmut pab1-1]|nr:hypothetical protein CC2G_005183 [Coprinopsis cinerea AmutBmut pab1-1]